MFDQVTGDPDPIDTWFDIEKKFDRVGVDFVFDQYFDLKGYNGDESNFKWCIAAIIHEYIFGSDQHHQIRAARWLLDDLVHAGQGNFDMFLQDGMKPLRKVSLAEFARDIGCYTGFWGFNRLEADAAHSLAWLFQQVATTGHVFEQEKKVKNPISEECFKFRKSSVFTRPMVFMDLQDALLFSLTTMLVIEPNQLFSEPNPDQLASFIKDIYDDYIYDEHVGTLKFYKSAVENGDRIGDAIGSFEFGEPENYEVHPGRRDTVISALGELIDEAENETE